RVADRAAGEGGAGPGRAGERLPGHPAPRRARRPLHRSPHAEQSGDAALLRAGAPLRADVRRRASLDVARARADGGGPRRAVPELHLWLRDGPADRAAAATQLPTLPLRRPALPLPRQGARPDTRAPAVAPGAGLALI